MLVDTAPKSSMKKHKKKDVVVEIEDSFLTYMATTETRKQDEIKEWHKHNMKLERLEQDTSWAE